MGNTLETEEFKYIKGTPETLKRYGFQKISDTTFAWFLNEDMESIFSLDTTKGIITWYKGDQLADTMILALLQDMLNEEVIENFYEEDDSSDEEEFDDTLVCPACMEEIDRDDQYCSECEEFVEPVPRGSIN